MSWFWVMKLRVVFHGCKEKVQLLGEKEDLKRSLMLLCKVR
jgi:hypothetical protein